VNFSAPVNPTISTEPGKLRMVFKRDPVTSPGSQSISFESPAFTQASYSEANGLAELDVAASIPLIASFGNNGKTITLSAPPTAANPATPAAKVATNPAQPPPSAPANAATAARLLAVVDPAHGGEERGAALADNLAEKDVTLGFGRLLRHELELRGFAVLLLRDADNTLPLDQRAGAANAARAAVYLSLHAASQGSGASVYTALLPVEDPAKATFHAWNSAQASALPLSRAVAAAIVAEMQKRDFSVRESSASLRPLNNVLMPAVAVELAPGPNGLSDLTSANYQQQAADAVADALVAVRDRLGVPQ
jgi:N-acetylmuramoyl-L-alanine amidase